jgi:hypothetical protein
MSCRAVTGMVVLESFFCLEPRGIGWSGLRNWTIWFGDYCELVLASVLVFVFLPWALFSSIAASTRLFPMLCPASSLAKVSLLSPF